MSRSRLQFVLAMGVLVVVVLALAAKTYLENQSPKVVSVPDAERGIPDLASLVAASDLIVVGHISSDGTTLPPQTPGSSLPTTRFPFDVERVARGRSAESGASVGTRISLLQPGGTIQQPIFFPGGPTRSRVVQLEDDTLMSAGDRYVLFLHAAGGAYAVVGGAQGRMSVDSQNRVHPLHPGIPPTRDHDGQPLDAFLADVARIS